MNERIKEIATEVGISVEYLNNTKQWSLIEGFAELIIQECIEQCYADYDSKEDWDKGVCWAVNQIKEHFGVK